MTLSMMLASSVVAAVTNTNHFTILVILIDCTAAVASGIRGEYPLDGAYRVRRLHAIRCLLDTCVTRNVLPEK